MVVGSLALPTDYCLGKRFTAPTSQDWLTVVAGVPARAGSSMAAAGDGARTQEYNAGLEQAFDPGTSHTFRVAAVNFDEEHAAVSAAELRPIWVWKLPPRKKGGCIGHFLGGTSVTALGLDKCNKEQIKESESVSPSVRNLLKNSREESV